MLDKETRALINAARTLGGGRLSVFLEDSELLRLCAIAAADLGHYPLVADIATTEELAQGYYGTPMSWFQAPVAVPFEQRFLEIKRVLSDDFATYVKGLCEIHKRRLKFALILQHQSLPQMKQIVPRSLLEYGLRPSETLASWLVWRKWLYDIDNRSAQETGYLFEPILAAAIGGVPYAARRSPIKRAGDPTKGRQVDCIDGRQAYEFKMRVTIAASGQGRFQEELDFARDCHRSGYTPILLVLDPTPSTRLDDLVAEYQRFNGLAYIGDEAWKHLEEKAGPIMGVFIEKYVRTPLREVDTKHFSLRLLRLVWTTSAIEIQLGGERFSIDRPRIPLLSEENDEAVADEE